MEPGHEAGQPPRERLFRRLPAETSLDETIASVDANPLPDPHAGRNVSQDDALRDA